MWTDDWDRIVRNWSWCWYSGCQQQQQQRIVRPVLDERRSRSRKWPCWRSLVVEPWPRRPSPKVDDDDGDDWLDVDDGEAYDGVGQCG